MKTLIYWRYLLILVFAFIGCAFDSNEKIDSSTLESLNEEITQSKTKHLYVFVDSYFFKDEEKVVGLKKGLLRCFNENLKGELHPFKLDIYALNCETANAMSLDNYAISTEEVDLIKDGSSTIRKRVIARWKRKLNKLKIETEGCNKIIDSFYRLRSILKNAFDESENINVLFITDWLERDGETNITEDQYSFVQDCHNARCETDEAALDAAIKALDNKESKLSTYVQNLNKLMASSNQSLFPIYHLPSNTLQVNKDGNFDFKLNQFWDETFKQAKLERIRVNKLEDFFKKHSI